MDVWGVGQYNRDSSYIFSIHKTYNGSRKAWNKLRLSLLKNAVAILNKYRKDKVNDGAVFIEMYEEDVKNLSCKDPSKLFNINGWTPFIRKYIVEE